MKRKEFLKMTAGLAGGVAGLPLMQKLVAAASAGSASDAGPGTSPSSAAIRSAAGRASFADLAAQTEAAGGDEALWKLIRSEFILDPGWIYLNFGGLGSCPVPVLNALVEFTQAEERAPSAGHDEKPWQEVKAKLARLLGKACRKEDIGLIGGATEGVNVIVNGLPLGKGDEVITSTHEHVAVHSALLNRMQRDGIAIRLFEPDKARAAGNVERIARLITPRTRLIIASHVTCTTGQLLPAREIAGLARSRNIWFALDGAQGPVCALCDIVEIGVDFYTCSTHKWVMGPKRTGFIYARQGMVETLRPQTVGGGSSVRYDAAKGELVLKPTAERFESGTQNDALFYAL
ncbi:MAG TPA: aminotransferase class V-fold PLP-dependent enzyme, partial [Acidobacteriota bacterium]|nr:aminotransferase class V-fold PLP-dependent enzyme [Acidobacteriota bacterium]